MKIFSRLLALALFLLSIGFHADAVPARNVTRQYAQPDGTTVTLRLVGDEFSHFFLTEDSEIVVSQNDIYYFAEPGVNGYPRASKILASNPGNRSAAARALLSTVDRQKMIDASNSHREALMEMAPYNNRMMAPAKATSANWPSGIGLFPNNTYPVTGSPNALIILVQFPDQAFTLPDAKQYFTDFASKEGFNESGLVGGTNSQYNAYGSALDYFKACSNGKFTPNFHVLGPVTLSNNMAYYGGNDESGNDLRPREMVEEAVKLLDPTTDFSIYDNDKDGTVDNIYVIYSGLGEANGGSANTIWPHSWTITSYTKYDGKYIRSYACSAELFAVDNSSKLKLADGIGTFCHEFSHVMGLPDMYQTQYTASVAPLTPGKYTLMDQGSYNNNSRTPPTYSVFERNAMGWNDIEVLNEGEAKNGYLEHMLTSNKGYAIKAGSDNEFFLLENRQKSGWDQYLPGHGMLIWHINYNSTTWTNNAPNNATQQYIDIVEAGGKADNTSSSTLAQYPFPGTKNVASFTSSTTPALKSWAGKSIDVPLTNIKENTDGTITFDICGGLNKLDPPVCNFTQLTVKSESPVTVTLSLPATASANATIHYIWMLSDASDMDEGVYTAPLTFNQSAELEYWLVDGDLQSDVKTLQINIGEVSITPSTATIVFKSNDSDSSTDLKSDTYPAQVEEGADVATFASCSKVYAGINGLKFSSSKANGSITLNLTSEYKGTYEKAIVKAAAFGSDAASVSINDKTAQSLTKQLAEYTFDLGNTEIETITIAATKRLYVKSITLVSGNQEPIVPKPETVSTPTFSVEAGEVEAGSVVEILCSTEGATIHFTVDGTEPTFASDIYSDALVIEEAMTIKAMATLEGWNNSAVASASYTIKANGGDDPVIPGEELTANFNFNGDDAYGMKLLSGNTSEYNAEEHVCTEGPLTLTLHGKTRWWSGKPNHLRLYSGSYITVASSDGHKITSVKLNVGNESHWDNTSYMQKVSRLDFNTTHTSGNTVLHNVEVQYSKITTSIVEIAQEEAETIYYNLQGLRIENPGAGLYIRVQNGHATKVIRK